MAGNPENVRVGPGWVHWAPLGTTEPDDLVTGTPDDWTDIDVGWVNLGYTDGGVEISADNTWEDIDVDQTLDPIATYQTKRVLTIAVSVAELTAANLEVAFNGGTVTVGADDTTFEPPATGDFTEAMLGFEPLDARERWVFRKVLQIGSITIARRKAPDKALIPMTFKALQPSSDVQVFLYRDDQTSGS